MGMGLLVSNDSPTSAYIVDVPASKEITAPSADDPSANAPAETSKPPACRKRGVWHARCSWVALRSVRLVRWVAACILSWFCYILATEIFFCAYLLLHATLHAALLPPVPAWEVLQELVETGATLYGGNWSGCTQKQMADLGIQKNYTQGLDYVDCEVEAAFCRQRNVTLYPAWEINGQLYAECYLLQELSEKLGLQPLLGTDDAYSTSHCAYTWTWEDPATIFSYIGQCNFEIVMFFLRALLFTIWILWWLRIFPATPKFFPKSLLVFCEQATRRAGEQAPPKSEELAVPIRKSVGLFAALALAAAALTFAAFAPAYPKVAERIGSLIFYVGFLAFFAHFVVSVAGIRVKIVRETVVLTT